MVEIGKSKFYRRKYHRGQWRLGHWVFDGIKRNSERCFLVEVPDRTVKTLRTAIERWILPGSHIVSDGWALYANIERWNDNICTHEVVVHQENFVNPNNPDVHTQNNENLSHLLLWMQITLVVMDASKKKASSTKWYKLFA